MWWWEGLSPLPTILKKRWPALDFDRFPLALAAWYQANARPLPWRKTKDPYRILVSELMLQQTRVSVVEPYYRRFVKRFPNLRAIAQADESELLSAWSGLGYYRRAKSLHLLAKTVREIPRSRAELVRLPGIGAYTAGAVASIAFGEHTPAVDANARRVFCRLFAKNLSSRECEARCARLMRNADPGEFNQALMELGATVCTSSAPKCEACPVAMFCAAKKKNCAQKYPRKSKPPQSVCLNEVCAAVVSGSRVGLRKLESGWWSGMWAFPSVRIEPERTPLSAARAEFGRGLVPLQPFAYQVTHHKISLHPFLARGRRRNLHWFTLEQAFELPMPAPHRKLLRQVSVLLHRCARSNR